MLGLLLAGMLAWAPALPADTPSEVPAGMRFLVELRDKLDARKVKPRKKFEARTPEALQASDGSYIDAGAKLKGRVGYVKHNEIELRFEQIDTGHGKVPIVATVTGVVGEKDVQNKAGEEGEIKATGHRGRDAAIGAVVLGGRDLVLYEGTRIELQLDRPLTFHPRR